MFKRLLILISFLSITRPEIYAARPDTLRSAQAVFCDEKPHIDGFLDDACWHDAKTISGFSQHNPVFGAEVTLPTKVRIIYDNQAVYIAAKMYDRAPDSILRQLGNRDDGSLNADWFAISLDTYDNQLDAYFFRLYASGVQTERRFLDWTYNAVWESAARITDDGWIAEIRIPYSAIRFPEKDIQCWGLQIERSIRRKRETDQWALIPKGEPNQQVFWGKLYGIQNIQAPLRLSLTPYLSAALEHYPNEEEGISDYSYAFSGGANLKYGINQSFTLDVSLLPDFSQVKSDNKVKNLSAFETIYGENRPFFIENMDLFKKGGLFYSRRIGRTPSGFYDIDDNLDSGMIIQDNPAHAKLVNAVKLSGRTNNGLGIGALNAFTRRTEATIRYPDGHEEKITTEPATNYNVLVLDQALKNNSSVYLINTNVWREGSFDKANVTGSGLSLYDNNNRFNINLKGTYALNIDDSDTGAEGFENTDGYHYEVFAGKVSGNFQYNAYRRVYNDRFDINDFGISQRNNEDFNRLTLKYNIFDPFWKIRDFYSFLQLENTNNHKNHKNIESVARFGFNTTTKNYFSIWYRLYVSPFERYDFYEARTDDRFYIKPPYWGTYMGFSSDYRNPLAFDGSMRMNFDERNYQQTYVSFSPRIRLSDKLFFDYRIDLNFIENDRGYVETDSCNNIIFGQRKIQGIENVINSRYMFRNNLSFGIWMRYYWYTGQYEKYYALEQDGYLSGDAQPDDPNNDFNFNAFNIDLKFNWEFAPGSNFSLVWKNSVIRDEENHEGDWLDNLGQTLESPKLNNISVKILYYLDYQEIIKKKDKQSHKSEG